MAKQKRTDSRSRFHVDYWEDRLYHKSFIRDGVRRELPAWSVRLQHLGEREAFTLDSANATLGAVQTQNQNNANAEAAQIAATVQMERAAARATLDSAAATQSAARTQDAIRQTQSADLATSAAGVLLNQQYMDSLAAATQTAVANQIATQTQVAVATTQGYADQARQADADRQGPITFLFFVCLPVFFVLLAVLILWGVWRWFKIQQDNQRNFGRNPEILPPPPPPEIVDHRSDARLLSQERKIIDIPNPPTRPVDQAGDWLDEVKDQLKTDEKKAEDDQSGS